ncbi:hypothetical protein DIPPA_09586 [Diplonema papillatum]|nr:hypothetical protein DIPPA_09586 [Diplonema papillatum]
MAEEVGEKVRVRPLPSAEPKLKSAPGSIYRQHIWRRRGLRVVACSALLGVIWWRVPAKAEERQLVRDSVTDYVNKKQDLRGIVDLEVYDELDTIGKLQRRKRWMGKPVPVINDAARELGFELHRYPWNYDRRPPPVAWYHPSYLWYRLSRQYYFTAEEIADIDRIYDGLD